MAHRQRTPGSAPGMSLSPHNRLLLFWVWGGLGLALPTLGAWEGEPAP